MSEARQIVRVLEADPELGYGLDEEARAAATRFAVAESLRLEPGPWNPHESFADGDGLLGLLVLDGLVKREVELANSACAELLGQGDVIRPWQEDLDGPFSLFEPGWEVLESTTVAILDGRFVTVACRWPAMFETVMARAIQRSRSLAFHRALSHLTRVDVRLLALFWHLADRWGRVSPEGVVVPLHLPHRTIARLVGAQRPSVTTAVGTLSDGGCLLRREDGTWLLRGEPPQDPREALPNHHAAVAG